MNYLQSGAEDGVKGPEPYDFGYLQALDEAQTPWARGRVFVTGGSGGGNVSLMANKLAPRTFAVVIDLCGMVRLSDDIAFNEPGGSSLNARYVRDPSSPFHLTVDRQALRDTSRLEHLQAWKSHGGTAKLIIVHGEEDATCPYADAVTLAENAKAAGIDVVPRWVKKAELDGKVFTSAGHPLGNRTEIVEAVAGAWLKPDSPTAIVRAGSSDFAPAGSHHLRDPQRSLGDRLHGGLSPRPLCSREIGELMSLASSRCSFIRGREDTSERRRSFVKISMVRARCEVSAGGCESGTR